MGSRKVPLPSVLLLMGLLVATALWLGILRGDSITPSSFIFRSAEELRALQHLLGGAPSSGGTWQELVSLAEKLTLWRLRTVTEEAPPGEACLPLLEGAPPERVRHVFEFGSPHGLSSRVYRLEYLSCRVADDAYRVTRDREGFGSSFAEAREPLLRGATPLRVLRLAIRDPDVTQDVIEALRQESIARCEVRYVGAGSRPHTEAYRFVAAAPEDRVVLEYQGEYDVAGDTATFVRTEP